MRRGVYILPNGLTLCGMFSGFYSIMASFKGDFILAGWAIIVAMVFDGLDGWFARITGSSSRFGIELDSLSDLVAFGVAPSILIFSWSLSAFGGIGWAVSFLYVGCGALRLARYNIQMDSTEKKYFTGMPIPAAAAVIATLVIFYHSQWDIKPEKSIPLLFLVVVLSWLMVSTLRFHGAKEIDFKRRKPFWFLIILIVVIVVIRIHPPISLFVFALSYMTWGIIENTYIFYKKRKPVSGEIK